MRSAMNQLGMSARAFQRVLKLGRTIADLAGVERIQAAHLAEAIHLRSTEKAELTELQRWSACSN
jgi:magnesium chelatase family protein